MPRLTSTIFHSPGSKLSQFIQENFHFSKEGQFLKQMYQADSATAIEIVDKANANVLKKNPCYWKIGMSMPDVGKHAKDLRGKGVDVSQEAQFKDIGFVAHLTDCDGNVIELLQHEFEQNFKGPYEENPITLGQITIRTSKLKETLAFYEGLGMKQLSVQPVEEYGFCLYFLTFTNDVPPEAQDLASVKNREWLWKKPYCTIEIQHVTKRDIEPWQDLKDNEYGWSGMRVTMLEEEAKILVGKKENCVLRDPNNIPIYIDVHK